MDREKISIYTIGNIEESHPCIAAISKQHKVFQVGGIEEINQSSIIIMDAEYYTNNANNMDIIGQNSLLLLNVSKEHKEVIRKNIGISLPIESDAYFISLKVKGKSKIYYIQDFFKTSSIDNLSVKINRKSGYKEDDSTHDTSTFQNIEENINPNFERTVDLEQKCWENFCENIMYKHNIEVSSEAPPSELVNVKWIYSQTLLWCCYEMEKWKGYTPRYQSSYGELTYTIWGFLDKEVDGQFQWIYVNCKGIWDISNEGTMNFNNYDEKGWSLGYFNIQTGIQNGDFKYYDCSPTNVNKQAQVTSSTQFEIGYEYETPEPKPEGDIKLSNIDKVSGVFSLSESVTKEISDWEIRLNKANSWTYLQNSPYNGESPSGWESMEYKVAHFPPRWEIKSLPILSTNTMDYEVMSVWRNDSVSNEIAYVGLNLETNHNYEALKNDYPGGWYYNFWQSTSAMPFTYSIDLGQISK